MSSFPQGDGLATAASEPSPVNTYPLFDERISRPTTTSSDDGNQIEMRLEERRGGLVAFLAAVRARIFGQSKIGEAIAYSLTPWGAA